MENKSPEEKDVEFMTSREMMRDIYTKVNRMDHVMYGNKEADIPGIAQRVKKLEDKERKQNAVYLLIAAISTGIGMCFAAAKEFFK